MLFSVRFAVVRRVADSWSNSLSWGIPSPVQVQVTSLLRGLVDIGCRDCVSRIVVDDRIAMKVGKRKRKKKNNEGESRAFNKVPRLAFRLMTDPASADKRAGEQKLNLEQFLPGNLNISTG